MRYIELSELIEKDEDEILSFIAEDEDEDSGENDDSYEISFSKDTVLFSSDSLSIANEFATAAYIGQVLSELTTNFNYNPISPADSEDFYFQIKEVSADKLAECLYDIASGFDGGEGAFMFNEQVSDFIDKVEKQKVVPVCADFMEVYQEYCNESDNDIEE